jgi:catechol 2,3-dioxygenase-like lactoylglutathione lyase family enzyme
MVANAQAMLGSSPDWTLPPEACAFEYSVLMPHLHRPSLPETRQRTRTTTNTNPMHATPSTWRERPIEAVLSLVLLFAFGALQAQEQPNLDWLLGTWHIPQMNVYETWEKAENGAGYEGQSVYRRPEGERLFESFKVHLMEGQWYLTVEMPGQEPVDFAMTANTPSSVVFENPEHDLPQSIAYTLKDGKVTAELKGTESGEEEEELSYLLDLIPESGPMAIAQAAADAYAHVSIGTSNMAENVAFYKKLGFRLVAQDNAPWPWIMLSDGAVNVQLNNDGMTYFGVSYFGADVAGSRVESAKAAGAAPFMEDPNPVPTTVFVDPDSAMGLGFIAMDMPFTMPEKGSKGALGTLGEIAVPVANYDSTKAWYGMLGFKSTGDQKKPYPWGIVTDGVVRLGLHQTTEFKKPALTYYSADSGERIAALIEKGVEVQNAIPGGDDQNIKNGLLESPDGWLVFIFEGDF